ncbi:flap endonuclease-1 [Candidatus Woesearchaeota archaeon]|nr:flap endonuclease-1 [Candidatus Woesearchaeota archaeon]
MGLLFKDLVVKKEISLDDLRGKILAIDSYNMLYQFLTTIRAADGALLTNSKGKVTSHLIGLFSRTTALMEAGIKLVFVFDGKPPAIKQRTWEKRAAVKEEAAQKFAIAEEEGQISEMRKFASRTAVLTKEMRDDAQKTITALGLPIVQAPSEGEAQAAHLVKKGDAFAVVSQDYDNLVFGAPLLIRNLSISGKRKKTGKFAYETVKPELIVLRDVLAHLHLTLDQLTALAMLVGTDYNPGGVPGIGPKKGLKWVQDRGGDLEKLFFQVRWKEKYPDLSWKEVFDTIRNMAVTDDYTLSWKKINEAELKKILIQEFEFGEERVLGKLEKLKELQKESAQKGLKGFF